MMRVPLGAIAVTLAGVAAPGAGIAAAQPQIRAGTQAVEIDARVVDREGRFVATLTKTDFEILEDGRPQAILDVYLVSGGEVQAAGTPAAAESATVARAVTRQTWLFVFDTVHLSPGSFARTRDAVLAFVRTRFQDGHLAGVVAGGRMTGDRLTTVRAEIERAIAGLKMPTGARSRESDLRDWPRFRDELEAVLAAANDRETIETMVRRACEEDPSACRVASPEETVRQKGRRIADDIRAETASSLSTLHALSSGLARIPGAKTVVFVSEGMIAEQLPNELQQAVGQAARSGARFYTIDARGLNRPTTAGIIDQPLADNAAGAGMTFDLRGDATTSLAVDTGGFAIRNENDFGRALDRIARDGERYYVIGYHPSNQTLDGKYRKVEVRVRPSGLAVRARRGYVALDPARILNAAAAPAAPPPPDPSPVAKTGPAPVAPSFTDPIPTLPPRVRTNAEDMVVKLAGASALRATGDPAADGWTAYRSGDLVKAAALLNQAAGRPDAPAWVSYALGFALVSEGARQDAAAAWERVRSAAPEFEAVYYDLADVYVQLQDEPRAVAVLRDGEKRFPASPDIFNALGVIHTRRGALDEAVRAFASAVTVSPEDSLGYFNLGRSYQMRYMKTVRYVSNLRRWTGREEDRARAMASFEKYVEIGGPYVQQAREAITALSWTVRVDREWR